MKKINKIVNITISVIIIILGILLQLLSKIKIFPINKILYITLIIYGFIKIIEYIITKPQKDLEGVFTALICFIIPITSFSLSNFNSTLALALTLIVWVSLMSLIKLIKLDKLHDFKNKMFYINLSTFLLFLIIGLITCFNLYFNQTVQYIVLGYFFIIVGILDLLEDLINSLEK